LTEYYISEFKFAIDIYKITLKKMPQTYIIRPVKRKHYGNKRFKEI